jgi:hypothetical protein
MVLFTYKGIFSDICLLLSAPNFPIMIDPAHMIWCVFLCKLVKLFIHLLLNGAVSLAPNDMGEQLWMLNR